MSCWTRSSSLFTGVFGASDEVLGSIESGVDFERRILDIYQQCRTPEEIDAAFQALRRGAGRVRSQHACSKPGRLLLEHFDEDVHARLRVESDRHKRATRPRGTHVLGLDPLHPGRQGPVR